MPFDVNCGKQSATNVYRFLGYRPYCVGKWLVPAIALVCLVMVLPAEAEKSTIKTQQTTGTITPGELTPTPDMWFYEQYMLRQQDPKQIVQLNAKFRHTQRQRRLTARKWYGFSKARPVMNVEPFHGNQFWR